jgi:hypothetical protein
MPWKENAGTDLARRIIELSDRISEHSKKLIEPGFVPTVEYIDETKRLTNVCRELTEETSALQAARDAM